MAAALDSTSYLDKNRGTDAVVRVGRIDPQPGKGLVRLALYIPSAEVFNAPNYDRGDDRGPDSEFNPEEARVTIYIDYETGTVLARQNPSVDTSGEVRVAAPTVGIQQTTDGSVHIVYDAANPFAPPDPTASHTVKGDIVVSPPSGTDDGWSIDGSIGDYPAVEAHHDDPVGRTSVLLQDSADNEGAFGPLLELPSHHDVGDGMGPSYKFRERRHLSGDNYEYLPVLPAPLGETSAPPRITPMAPYGDEYSTQEPALA